MKHVFTSYFAVSANHPQAKSISAKNPKFYKGNNLNIFKPFVGLLEAYKKGLMSRECYRGIYTKAILSKITFKMLDELLEDGDVLLCWEKDIDECHRGLVLEFLNSNGFICEELKVITKKEKTYTEKLLKSMQQISLF